MILRNYRRKTILLNLNKMNEIDLLFRRVRSNLKWWIFAPGKHMYEEKYIYARRRFYVVVKRFDYILFQLRDSNQNDTFFSFLLHNDDKVSAQINDVASENALDTMLRMIDGNKSMTGIYYTAVLLNGYLRLVLLKFAN
jgi:hypothetical protein